MVVQPIQIISKCILQLSPSIRVNFSLCKFLGRMQNQISGLDFRLQNRYRLLTILGKLSNLSYIRSLTFYSDHILFSDAFTSMPIERANPVKPDGPGSSLVPSTDKSSRNSSISATVNELYSCYTFISSHLHLSNHQPCLSQAL